MFSACSIIPNLIPNPEPEGNLRKFGLMRKSYLENYRRGIYSGLLLSGELKKHLLIVQEQAEERFDWLVEQMAKQEGVTEQLKAQNQMLWVRRINNIRARAEEIVREEIVYIFYKDCNGAEGICPITQLGIMYKRI